MEDLIQVIAFIAFAIIAGLVKKAGSNKQKQQRSPVRPQQPRPTQQPRPQGESGDGSLGDLLADIARQLGGDAPPSIPKAAPPKSRTPKNDF